MNSTYFNAGEIIESNAPMDGGNSGGGIYDIYGTFYDHQAIKDYVDKNGSDAWSRRHIFGLGNTQYTSDKAKIIDSLGTIFGDIYNGVIKEGRTDPTSGSGDLSNLTDFQALNYIASYGDLINAFGTDIEAAKSHYINYGKSEGRTLDNFDEWGYLASNNDLMKAFGSNTTEAIKHYISYGMSEGRSTNLFNASSYLNNYGDLKNAFGDNEELATKHYVEYGFNEGRTF